ncbi:hypothetical protein X777_09035 [Ooceraea biroi]|uniref:Uncharacterized protein n=1 Tax=Ooceraea biroi TaxID=2015173 RepID=A0A026W8I2_OOCBI|nr:hypothetical protein X777_09035 [Ooceraea biroi]
MLFPTRVSAGALNPVRPPWLSNDGASAFLNARIRKPLSVIITVLLSVPTRGRTPACVYARAYEIPPTVVHDLSRCKDRQLN